MRPYDMNLKWKGSFEELHAELCGLLDSENFVNFTQEFSETESQSTSIFKLLIDNEEIEFTVIWTRVESSKIRAEISGVYTSPNGLYVNEVQQYMEFFREAVSNLSKGVIQIDI